MITLLPEYTPEWGKIMLHVSEIESEDDFKYVLRKVLLDDNVEIPS